MKKVFVKLVKGKKDEKKESGGITPSQSGDLISPARTPEDERFLGLDNSSGYIVDFLGKDKTLTKLHKAAWQGNLEKLKTALKKVEVDAVDKHNRTALHFAVAQGHPNIVWFLLGNNANTSVCDDQGHTPLLKAIECGHKECMNLLLERGADVNVSDYTGNTGLHVAVGQASFDTASALLKKGAETEVSNNAGDYPLHIATRLENKDLVDLLLGAGASVDVLDRENRTPLMLAAKTGNGLLARLFVQHGADLTIVDSNGWTAQDYAMLGGHESVAASLKSFGKYGGKNEESKAEESSLVLNDHSGSWEDSQTEEIEKEQMIEKLKKFCAENRVTDEEEENVKYEERIKSEESTESPDAQAIPPFCQPPRSWEMIQAGMIDENKSGNEPKRRSITTLGTLHSRRESFTEGSISSPEFTLSLNRRRGPKADNAFAKQRFSFNEEESLSQWIKEENSIRRAVEKIELENILNFKGVKKRGEVQAEEESDWDSASTENPNNRPDSAGTDTTRSAEIGSRGSESAQSGTLGREGTMQEVEEIWVTNPRLSPPRTGEQKRNSWDSEDGASEKEGTFPPPPTALELGVDMAKSIKYMKGISVDQPNGPSLNTGTWKNFYDSHSLDCLEERDFIEASKGSNVKIHGRHKSTSVHRGGEEVFKCQKPRDRMADVSRRINEQLECYDQALRELAESSKKLEKVSHQNYYSLPSAKSTAGDFPQNLAPSASSFFLGSGPHSLPFCSEQVKVENNERLSSEDRKGPPSEEILAKTSEKKTKRHMLLAMREVKHAVHVANSYKTSMDDQILSPLTKPEDSFDLDEKSSPKGFSSSSEGNSPPDENPFFGMGRQETVLERNEIGRKSSSSDTGEESTLWLQDGEGGGKGARGPHSDDDVSEIAPDETSTHKRTSSFSPLGVIQREMEEEENRATKSSGPGRASGEIPSGENEEQNEEEPYREQSPDISLSSGPIEPIGAEKDSGSEPESSHNDASPTHNYALKNQHEWLKSHLKAATSEKNKLEELTAQLSEKAERLQYELADAKEAAKSRDEVIHLLQGQLARMEAAYTKSLEESVQSRLQLTSHEQEILHLKELCYRYEEEKEAAASGAGSEFLQELQLKIKVLEEEKDKMKKEITHLEEEKCLLEKRLRQDKNAESEMIDQCQRWKERCGILEEKANDYDSKQASLESYFKEKDREFTEQKRQLQQQYFQLEKKYLLLDEENIELKAKVQSLTAELDAEKRKATTKDEKDESISELKKKNIQMEIRLKNLERELEEKMVKKLKEKEEEVGGLVKQFNRERDSLVASYEKKLIEGKSEQNLLEAGEWKKENQWLRQIVKSLQDQIERLQKGVSAGMVQQSAKNESFRSEDEWGSASIPVTEMQRDLQQLNELVIENLKLRKEISDLAGKVGKEGMESTGGLKDYEPKENSQIKSEISELKTQVNSLRMLLESEQWPSTNEEYQKNVDKRFEQRPEVKRKGVGKEDELAWSSLYGMKAIRRRRGGRSTSVTEGLIKVNDVEQNPEEDRYDTKKSKPSEEYILNRLNAAAEEESEISRNSQKLEFIQLKKEILSLQSKMSDEKNLRHALENQIIKMNLDLKEKENLEKEMNCLKKKVDRDCLRRSEMELIEYQKDLDSKREKYLGETKGGGGGEGGGGGDENFKAKCEILAKEREKSKELRSFFGRRTKSFDSPVPAPSPIFKIHHQQPEIFFQPRFVALDPNMKSKLETELDRSIRKYVQESSSAPSISNLQIEFVKKNYF